MAGNRRHKNIPGETMAGEAEVQVSHFLDEHGLGSFQIKLIVWSVLIALIDGYDIGAIAFAAPHLIAEWHVPPKCARPGAERQQYRRAVRLADFRLDRRPLRPQDRADHLANLLFGVFTFSAAYSTNLTELSWLRFIAGLGIGGVIPNVVAINAESAPRNLRATLAIIAVGHGSARRRARRLRQRGARAAIWLADPVRDRRRRADRHRARRHFRPAGIDQIHGAARKPPRRRWKR